MLIVPYLSQSQNYIPIMSPCFRHIPMSSPFYAHQMALNSLRVRSFAGAATGETGGPGASVSGAMRTMNCRRSRTLILTPQRSPKCEVPHIWNGNWSVLNPIEPYWTRKFTYENVGFPSHTATTLHHETCGFNQWKMVGPPGQAVSNEIPRQWPAKIWWLDMTSMIMAYRLKYVDCLRSRLVHHFWATPSPHNKSTWCLGHRKNPSVLYGRTSTRIDKTLQKRESAQQKPDLFIKYAAIQTNSVFFSMKMKHPQIPMVQTKIFSHQNGYRFGGTPLAAPVLAAGEGVKELLWGAAVATWAEQCCLLILVCWNWEEKSRGLLWIINDCQLKWDINNFKE